jgi:hypothetical protein
LKWSAQSPRATDRYSHKAIIGRFVARGKRK